ncbi:MAG: hypothetical protein JRI77_02640 [Deltaproteobacteria bacterium]|nr:hypothetical protein [Deltaproteobacteria bacterium]
MSTATRSDRRQKYLDSELNTLRKRVLELEKERRLQFEIETEKSRIEHTLRERVKELNCLYGFAELVERHGRSIEKIFQGLVELLCITWRYSEITCARVKFEGKQYRSLGFKATRWKQIAEIKVFDKKAGTIEVYYLKQMPTLDEGPFLKEERVLIDSLAWRLGRLIERIHVEKQLEVERVSLRNMNVALREVGV